MTIFIFLAVIFLSVSNGGNDNFKGVATLFGSKVANFKTALAWATLTTFLGSLCAIIMAQSLTQAFSGKGLVPGPLAQMPGFAASLALAAGLTVALASRLGLPISTTHALTGGMVGVGLSFAPNEVNFSLLGKNFFLPLIASPFIAIMGAVIIYPIFKKMRNIMGVQMQNCLCIGNQVVCAPFDGSGVKQSPAVLTVGLMPTVSIDTNVNCQQRYVGKFLGIDAKKGIDVLHFFSGGVVSFARGLNDTPKIAAIMLLTGAVDANTSFSLIGVSMALGGILFAKRVALTMSNDITAMNDGQGFTANLVTAMVVLSASQFGQPVSTTHVSCGALFGIGAVTKKAHWGGILKIVLSWVGTLPLALALGYLSGHFLLK